MKKILFVCHGNICRSPMAEYVMKFLVEKAGRTSQFLIASAATSTEEIGNGVYPPVRRLLAAYGIDCSGHAARQLKADDFSNFDLLIGMDHANVSNMRRLCAGAAEKIHLLSEYTDHPGSEVADPWYTRDFEQTWQDVWQGCTGLLSAERKGDETA